MLHTAALPFVFRYDTRVIRGGEVITTAEERHGLLRLDGERLHVQWRTTRTIHRVGLEIRTDHEQAPIRDEAIPLRGLGGARLRRVWAGWRRRPVLVLTAADLRAFDVLDDADDAPGLPTAHPAELVLEVRREDVDLAEAFVSALSAALSEDRLRALDGLPRLAGEPPPQPRILSNLTPGEANDAS